MFLSPEILDRLQKARERYREEGRLVSTEDLVRYYRTFDERFGPNVLAKLDGEALLNSIHLHGNKDSLVYWLEFKDDDEFPARFGSIAGGNALKFGLYKRKETNEWMTGSAQKQTILDLNAAIALARKHRDQLIAGANYLFEFNPDTPDAYIKLQTEMNKIAPDVSDTAWGHKYFSLIRHQLIDDYHNAEYQRFHLIKCLVPPPDQQGRYVCGSSYRSIAQDLEAPLNHVTTILNLLNGRPYRVWRIGTKVGQTDAWPLMRDRQVAAIGWDTIGDLSNIDPSREGKFAIKDRLRAKYYPDDERLSSRKAGEIYNFVSKASQGDVVVAADGERVLAAGRITGSYKFESDDLALAPHRRAVDWLNVSEWKLPRPDEGLRTTFYELGKDSANLIAIERKLLESRIVRTGPTQGKPTRLLFDGKVSKIHSILERKGQAILYGPPGTGKTFWAKRASLEIVSIKNFGVPFNELSDAQKDAVYGNEVQRGFVRICTFHPGYGYEDFIEGYRPGLDPSGRLQFSLRPGIFKRLCDDARSQPGKIFVLIIDEINRGDIPRIFGELITLLELDKRGDRLLLPLSGEPFIVPRNVHIVGTMNTADRSIALLDVALRRRFGFVELMPEPELLNFIAVQGIPLGPWLAALNERVRQHTGRDGRNLQIGHSYFLSQEHPVRNLADFTRILAEDIIPLLEEYCYADFEALHSILGGRLIDRKGGKIRDELFKSENADDLIQALSTEFPDIGTTIAAAQSAQVDDASEEEISPEDAADQ